MTGHDIGEWGRENEFKGFAEMAMSAKLEMRQGQQLVMTPQLQQAIKLLQLSNMELSHYVDQELERNPLLEREEADELAALPGDDDSRDGEPLIKDGSVDEPWLDLSKANPDSAAVLDTDYENIVPNATAAEVRNDFAPDLSGGNWKALPRGNFSGEESNLESYVSSEISLKDHLTQQLNLAVQGHAERLIGQYLIDMVDDAGYLHADLDELAEKLGAALAMIGNVLQRLQQFDPPGVFARDLRECMALQLKEQNRFDPQIDLLLKNLHLLAAHDIRGLRRAVGVDDSELGDMIAEIKQLNPKPGLKYGSVQVQPVVPDVFVRTANDGSWHVELNSDTLPRVLVNRKYYAMVSKTLSAADDKTYFVDCLQSANWLAKSLDQRARTILKVSQEIVRQQDGFLTHGVQHLRPLNLRTVADAISMHESTVSRVTSNKYMATSRGIFELKYFFTSAIASSRNGEAHSSEAVRYRIKQLIDAENAKTVLSDDKLVERLRADGIDIARRTVAKYREALAIPSSVQRRRQKRMVEQAQPGY